MAYEKLNLKNGTVLNEEHLAHIESGIAEAEKTGGSAYGAVLYTEQNLTEEQQYRARMNIRSGVVGNSTSDCLASGQAATAQGYCTISDGIASHAEGYKTFTRGTGSHSEGCGTKAYAKSCHVEGEYNIIDEEGSAITRGKYVHIVGNGTYDWDTDTEVRSNAHTLDWNGVPWFAGDRVMLGGTGMDDENAVALMPIFVKQTLTDAQKAQARANIGAATVADILAALPTWEGGSY